MALPKTREVSLDEIIIDKNYRSTMKEKGLQELAESIKTHGVIQRVTLRQVKHKLILIAGHRRYRACQIAGLETIPADIKEMTDEQAFEISVMENLHREDPHPMDEAMAFQLILDRPGYTVNDIAVKIGKSIGYVYQRLKLNELSDNAKKIFLEDDINASQATLLANLQHKDQDDIIKHNIQDGSFTLTTNQLKDVIQDEYMMFLKKAPWKKDDAELVPASGSCESCSKRTCFNTLLFPDISTEDDRCLDKKCFENKSKAYISKRKAEIKKETGAAPVLLSDSYWTGDEKILSANQHKLSTKNACPHTIKGIYVEGSKKGNSPWVCTNPKCSVHYKVSSGSSRFAISDEEKEKRTKERLENKIQNAYLDEVSLLCIEKIESYIVSGEELLRQELVFLIEILIDKIGHGKQQTWRELNIPYPEKYINEWDQKRDKKNYELLMGMTCTELLKLFRKLIIALAKEESAPKPYLSNPFDYFSEIAIGMGVNVKEIRKDVRARLMPKKKAENKKSLPGPVKKKKGLSALLDDKPKKKTKKYTQTTIE